MGRGLHVLALFCGLCTLKKSCLLVSILSLGRLSLVPGKGMRIFITLTTPNRVDPVHFQVNPCNFNVWVLHSTH